MTQQLLPRASPESQGVASAAIAAVMAGLDAIDHVHTATIVRHGRVIGETTWAPYDRESPHLLFSVSKSFTSMAVGFAVADGLFDLDDRVADLLAVAMPADPSDGLDELRVRHLLDMTVGHETEPADWHEGDWVRTILAAPLAHAPGTHWTYNTAATYLLAVIVQRAAGMRLVDYLRPRLFDPLGFGEVTWEQSPAGFDVGGYGISARPEELAAFGQLLLQRGSWNGAQIAPVGWIDDATSAHADNSRGGGAPDWVQGYGYQFWRCRHGAYRADGAFGQYVVVLPEHDAVVAITGGLPDMQEPLDVLWRELIPALEAGDADRAPADVPAMLRIPPLGGELRDEPIERAYAAPIGRLRVEGGSLLLGEDSLAFSPDAWIPGVREGRAVACSGGWRGDVLVVDIRTLAEPFTHRLTLGSDGAAALHADLAFGDATLVWQGMPLAATALEGTGRR
jgi:CubicO group peptidase (beta-lactamase class C family)